MSEAAAQRRGSCSDLERRGPAILRLSPCQGRDRQSKRKGAVQAQGCQSFERHDLQRAQKPAQPPRRCRPPPPRQARRICRGPHHLLHNCAAGAPRRAAAGAGGAAAGGGGGGGRVHAVRGASRAMGRGNSPGSGGGGSAGSSSGSRSGTAARSQHETPSPRQGGIDPVQRTIPPPCPAGR